MSPQTAAIAALIVLFGAPLVHQVSETMTPAMVMQEAHR
jgi:hypothetical protein